MNLDLEADGRISMTLDTHIGEDGDGKYFSYVVSGPFLVEDNAWAIAAYMGEAVQDRLKQDHAEEITNQAKGETNAQKN